MRRFKTILLATTLVTPLVAVPALAQEAGASDDDGEIVVTARRQSESLQDVPASVSVLTAATIERTGANSADDFAQLTPGVTIVTGTAEAGETSSPGRASVGVIRGMGPPARVAEGLSHPWGRRGRAPCRDDDHVRGDTPLRLLTNSD